MVHRPTVDRCIVEIDSGLNITRWLNLWHEKNIDEAVAVAFYHQALQDAREALRALAPDGDRG
jgi:hypothetical protein